MASEDASPPDATLATKPKIVPDQGRPWLGSALLLSGGVLIIVALLMGWGVVLWWRGDVNALAETFSVCLYLILGLAALLSLWWVGNILEQRFASDQTKQAEPPVRVAHLLTGMATLAVPVLLLMAVVSFPDREIGLRVAGSVCGAWLFFAFHIHVVQVGEWVDKALERRFPKIQRITLSRKNSKEDWPRIGFGVCVFVAFGLMLSLMRAGFSPLNPKDKSPHRIPVSVIEMRQATLGYWQGAVANLHGLRFQTLSETESAQAVFDRLDRDLRNRGKLAKAASTVNVDPELVAMVQRHLEWDDQLLSTLAQISALMLQYQIDPGTDSAHQSGMKWLEIQAKLATQPELWEKLPPEMQHLINSVIDLEHQQLKQRREIEIMQAVLQERYKGVRFPLPEIEQ